MPDDKTNPESIRGSVENHKENINLEIVLSMFMGFFALMFTITATLSLISFHMGHGVGEIPTLRWVGGVILSVSMALFLVTLKWFVKGSDNN